MKKALPFLALLCMALMLLCSMPHTKAEVSGEGLIPADPLEGIWKPAEQTQASFPFRLPQWKAAGESANRINEYYRLMSESRLGLLSEDVVSFVDFELTCNDGRYLSVLLRYGVMGGQGEIERIKADTFACDGVYAGERISLSQLLGLEQEDESGIASQLVYELVWQIAEWNIQNQQGDYLDGLTREEMMAAFVPEYDFYLDEEGNIVFYIQSGEISAEMAGVQLYPFAPAELFASLI